MTRDWQADLGSDRAVLLGGGRGLVLGFNFASGEMIEDLDERWFISQATITGNGLIPEIGDIVVWRGGVPAAGLAVNAPTRVIDVGRDGDGVQVTCLEDLLLIDRTPDDIDLDEIAQDRLLTEDELWELLGWWGLNPACGRCGGELQPIVYGMPAGPPVPGVILGGCMVSPADPTARCNGCGFEERRNALALPDV